VATAPKRRAQRLSFTLHPERDGDLYAWVQQVDEGELAAHLKVALREYIARYAGQTLEVAVALRRLQVPALPGGGAPAVSVGATAVPAPGGAGGVDRSASGTQAGGVDSDLRASAKVDADGNANANAEAEPSAQALDPAEREALQALNAQFGEG
jgi:hypothetical protein